MIVDIGKLKLSAQRGLLGNVFPNLRAVCVNPMENGIYICFYIDGKISEEDHESCECVLDDIIADFAYLVKEGGPGFEFETPIIRLDYPQKPPVVGHWVYYRRENSS